MSMNDIVRFHKFEQRNLDIQEGRFNQRIDNAYIDDETSVGSYGNELYKIMGDQDREMIRDERERFREEKATNYAELKEARARRDAILKLRRIRQRPLQPQPLHHQNPLQPQNQHHQQVLSPLQFVRLARLSQEE